MLESDPRSRLWILILDCGSGPIVSVVACMLNVIIAQHKSGQILSCHVIAHYVEEDDYFRLLWIVDPSV